MICLRNPGELQLKQPLLLAIKEEIRVNLKTLVFEGDSQFSSHPSTISFKPTGFCNHRLQGFPLTFFNFVVLVEDYMQWPTL